MIVSPLWSVLVVVGIAWPDLTWPDLISFAVKQTHLDHVTSLHKELQTHVANNQ